MSSACHPFKPDEEIILYETLSSEDTETTDTIALVLSMSDEDDEDDEDDEEGQDNDSAACDDHEDNEFWSEDECALIKAYYENEEDEDEEILWTPTTSPSKPKKFVCETAETSHLPPSTCQTGKLT